MANINKVNLAYVKRWEGGLSRDPNDPASANPVPDRSGYHTNKGVTWATFVGLAKLCGYVATPALFYQMPDRIWLKIFKIGYWDPMRGDYINDQGVAEVLSDFAWGSGPGTATLILQKYLGLATDGRFGPQTLQALNRRIKLRGGKAVFKEIFAARVGFLKSLGNWSIYGTGWMNRLNDFYKYGISVAGRHKVATGVVLGAAAGAIILAYNWPKIEKRYLQSA